MVEFALVAPLLFLLLLGIIQLGFLFAGQNGMTNAAREAARYASTLPTPDTVVAGSCSSGGNAQAVYLRLTDNGSGNLRQYIPGYLPNHLVTAGTGSPANCATWAENGTATGVDYCTSANGDGTFALNVRVRVVYDHPLFVPLVGRLFSSSNSWRLGAVEEMRVEGANRSTSSSGGFSLCP